MAEDCLLMDKLWVAEGRNGRVWPQAMRTIAESRAQGRRVIVYVPEQMTLLFCR